MEKTTAAAQSAQALFIAQLPRAGWSDAVSGPEMVTALSAALSAAHQQVRAQYPNDLTKLNACDALFRQAQLGLNLTAAALTEAHGEAESPAEAPADQPAPAGKKKHAPSVPHAAVLAVMLALFVVLAVMMRYTSVYGTIELPAYFFSDAMLALLLLMALWEALFRVNKLRDVMDADGMGGLIFRLGKLTRLKWMSRLGKFMMGRYHQRLPKPQVTAVIVKASLPDRELLLERCLDLLRMVDSNLPLFTSARQEVQKAEFSPLLRALIQEYYSNRQHMSEALQTMLLDQLQANRWTLVDYAPEHEHLFTTQPMAETFTIFPAILDDRQQLIETGFACVKEE